MSLLSKTGRLESMRQKAERINLFQYLDYRVYLKAVYQHEKKSNPAFSFRNFSKRAGFTSPNFLKLVMDGKRNLTEESTTKFMVALHLNKQEQEFFRNLVFYNQAQTLETKNHYYQRLLQSQKFSQLKPIEKYQYDYCSEWYHAVVRELVMAQGFDGTALWLSKRISPEITAAQAQKSLELLVKLGFLTRDDLSGKYHQTSALVTTGAELASMALYNYHLSLIDLTKTALEITPATERDVSAMVLGVSKDKIPLLKKKIQEFRQDVLKLVSTETSSNEVLQISVQMFPLTKTDKGNL